MTRSIEIGADPRRVFGLWTRYEDLPRLMESVRRVKQIDARRLLWDVDIMGRQVVFEAEIVESVPDKLLRWKSRWGASTSGEVRFEALPNRRTLLCVAFHFRPQGLLEYLGTRLGLVNDHVGRDLARFRHFVERLPPDEPIVGSDVEEAG